MVSENGNTGMIGAWDKPYETGSFNRLIAYTDLKAKYLFEQNSNDSSFCGNNAIEKYSAAQYIMSGFNGGYALYIEPFNYSGVISLPQKILNVLSGPEWTVEYMTKQNKSVSSIGTSTYSFSLSAGGTSKPIGLYTNPLSSSADYPVFGGNYNVYITGTSRSIQQWVTNTITFESGLFLYYKNNILMGSGVASQSQFTWVSGIIGGYANDGLAYLYPHPGYIDNFKVWNRAVISGYNYSEESRAIVLEKDTYLVPENNFSATLGRHNKQFSNIFSPVTAKAWAFFVGDSTLGNKNTFNVSSITRLRTGCYRVYFTNPMASSNYITSVQSMGAPGYNTVTFRIDEQTTTYCQLNIIGLIASTQVGANSNGVAVVIFNI